MSLILEALRKSEAERQRGMPPRLDSPMLRPTRRRQRLAPGLALLVLGVPAAGWFVYRSLGPEPGPAFDGPTVGDVALQSLSPTDAVGQPPQAVAPQQDAPRLASVIEPVQPQPASADPVRIAANEAVGAAAAASGSGSFGSELTLPEARRPHTPSLASSEAARPAQAAPAAPVSPLPATDPPAAPPAALVSAEPVAAPAPAPQQLAVAAPPAAMAEPALAAPAPTEPVAPALASPATPREIIPMIYELDFSVRRDLPKMDMSLHVYSADAQSRFIVVNGKRFAEGEQPETEVTLREIRRDGAVLVFRGTSFVLPRQGF